MYVCICNAITDRQIRQAADNGVSDLWQLQKKLDVASNCGKCKQVAIEILAERKSHRGQSPGTTKSAASV
jgi:bacterioferritin-associated ferredoxin